MALADDPTASFERFMEAFPARDGGQDSDVAREAWRRAVARGVDPETIIAGAIVYRAATEGRARRYVMSARRWLDESRWRDAGAVSAPSIPPMVWIEYGSPEWCAWTAFRRATRGKTPPIDSRGGWRFPSRWPPGAEHVA